ncbi:uncharacterized protein BDZ99DRAFT_479635 [Mytilinidion resinicola]|uniref:Uncharacterized protein n=1 Tax=Mytilinidion resinicola TaxID=574789 RepID=A0A6A6YC27_9PEZI|nr:uncharacterized protein BDZ99DRAFT_479635 [Mytilinidion resinicola]KAF2806376.1 hypothetical protein BDZ99DRAFT_479635 [Mytilinidion resinicola]
MGLLSRYYFGTLILLALTFFVLIIEVTVDQNPKPSSVSNSTSPTSTSSSSSTTTPTDPPIYLSISSTPPDPLGVSKVSGFYGPGAWAAWMLWIVGSWYRAFTGKRSKLDPNTLSFVIATNYAALDLMRRVQQVRQSVHVEGHPEDDIMAQYGAAMTIVWQGTAHILLQSIVFGVFHDGPRPFKFWMLSGGLMIPLLSQALASVASMQFSTLDDRTPAMFWNGMGSAKHDFLLFVNWLWVPVFILVLLLAGILLYRLCVGSAVFRSFDWQRIWVLFYSFYPAVVLTAFTVFMSSLCVLLEIENPSVVAFDIIMWICFVPVIPVGAILVTISIVFIFLPFHVLVTILKFIFTGGKSFHKACFFIPCAPQSILEMDQAFALLAGVVMLVGIEIAPPIVKSWTKKWREKRLFEQEVNRRIGLGVNERERVNSGFEMTSTSRTNSELERLSQRTNSGVIGEVV